MKLNRSEARSIRKTLDTAINEYIADVSSFEKIDVTHTFEQNIHALYDSLPIDYALLSEIQQKQIHHYYMQMVTHHAVQKNLSIIPASYRDELELFHCKSLHNDIVTVGLGVLSGLLFGACASPYIAGGPGEVWKFIGTCVVGINASYLTVRMALPGVRYYTEGKDVIGSREYAIAKRKELSCALRSAA